MFFSPYLFGTMVMAGLVGLVAEQTGFTKNGILQSVVICIGGAMVFHFFAYMFRFGFGSPGLDAVIAAVGALVIVPTHWRK